MNKNQRILYKALEVLGTALLTLENAENITDEMTKEQIKEVVDKFSKKYTEFDEKELYQEAYDFERYANNIITGIVHKLNDEQDGEYIET